MDRRSANLFALTAMVLAFASLPVAWASTHCTADGVLTIDGKPVTTMTSVVSSASTRATNESAAAGTAMTSKGEKKSDVATAVAQSTPTSNPATAGGGVAGGGDEGGLGDNMSQPGAHRRGPRWQSFLPGVIR